MDSQGTGAVRLSTSSALIPLQGATVTITKTRPDGTQELLAGRVPDVDGLTAPVMVETPPMAESRSYQNTSIPYAAVDIRVERTGFDRVLVKNAQVFSNTHTKPGLPLLPTPHLPSSFDRTETFVVPPQSLS